MSEIDQTQTLSSEFLRAFAWIKLPDTPLSATNFLRLAKQFDDAVKKDSSCPFIIGDIEGNTVVAFRRMVTTFNSQELSPSLFSQIKDYTTPIVNLPISFDDQNSTAFEGVLKRIYKASPHHRRMLCG